MAHLEDEIPCLRQIYEYDPTYHEYFREKILDRVAEVFEIYERSYYLFPVGIYRKFEEEFFLIRICLRRPSSWDPEDDITDNTPRSMMIQYFQSHQEWNREIQKLKAKTRALGKHTTRKQFNQIYNFEFRLNL